MPTVDFNAREFILHEANLKQLQILKPNVAVLPWGATEAHNFHLPHGTDVIQVNAVAEAVVQRANFQGAKCVLLPCIPFGNDNLQLGQVATITMRGSTQQAVLFDVADSLVRQGVDRLVILNGHGGNEHSQMIRDIMLDLPIFIARINFYATVPKAMEILTDRSGDHANEFETSVMLHLCPQWIAPLVTADDGQATPSRIPGLTNLPGAWAPRDWAALTKSTGVGDPRDATAEKGQYIFEQCVAVITPALVQLSAAKNGDFPYVVRTHAPHRSPATR